MKLSEESIEKGCSLAECAYRYLSGVNEEWKRASIAWKLWPADYVKENRALPWLCIILPAFLEYYLEQRGVEGEERHMAVAFFAFAMSHGLGSDDKGRGIWAERSAKFAEYFRDASKDGESALGIISIAAFLEKKRDASAEKLFACALLYAYTLGAYWVMRSIDESRAVNSAKQIALFVKCDKLTEATRHMFDAFAGSIELVEDDDENEDSNDVGTSSNDSDSKDPEGFFDDDDKFDDEDPGEDEDIVATRAKYSGSVLDVDDLQKAFDFKCVALAMRLTNDFWRYITGFRLNEENEFEILKADRQLTYIAVFTYVTLTFINEMLFKGELKEALSVARHSFAYRFSSQEPGFFLSTEFHFSSFLATKAMDGNEILGTPEFIKYMEAKVDTSISNPVKLLETTACVFFKYVFNVGSIWLSGIANAKVNDPSERCSPSDIFEEMFDFISVTELARITVEAYRANCVQSNT